MKGQLIFRIFVDILSYPYEFFCFEVLYNLFNSFRCCAFTFHTWVRFIKSLFHKMSMIINTIIIIIYKIIFTLSFNIFCNSNKIFIKSFYNSLFISNFSTCDVQSLYFTSLLPDSLFIIPHVVLTVLWEFRINLSYSIVFGFLVTTNSTLE